MPAQTDYTATREFLYTLKNKGTSYGLNRIWRLVTELKHPERTFPSIHVAGTNGKGSTCAMLEAIYRANGYKTGLYTSPYLLNENELIQINRTPLTEMEIILYNAQLKSTAKKIQETDSEKSSFEPSFFEWLTAMAFLHFATAKINLGIIETGLGGRLDATNVVEPELSIITSISLDHMELLGDTIEQIALEKAGIIKPGRPVLIGKLPQAAEAVIRKFAGEKACTLYSVHDRFPDEKSLPETNLAGSFQRWNAATATYATEILDSQFPIDSKKNQSVLQMINWLGRWQTIQLKDKAVILDATHNPEGVIMLEENLQALIKKKKCNPIIIAGTTGESRANSLMPLLSRYASQLYLVQPDQQNATPTDFLESCLPKTHSIPVFHRQINDLFPTANTCSVGEPEETIVVTGSIYLTGQVLRLLTDKDTH